MAKNRKVELSTIIGKGSKIDGKLTAAGGIRIDGEVEGNIASDGFVTIGEGGVAKADIKAQECLISGRVIGNVTVQEGLELDNTANLSGDIVAKILKIHSGAIFNGSSAMGAQAKKNLQKKNVERSEKN